MPTITSRTQTSSVYRVAAKTLGVVGSLSCLAFGAFFLLGAHVGLLFGATGATIVDLIPGTILFASGLGGCLAIWLEPRSPHAAGHVLTMIGLLVAATLGLHALRFRSATPALLYVFSGLLLLLSSALLRISARTPQ